MELKKLAIALLALYIVYCFMSKENYAFDEKGLIFPADAGYIDIYHKTDGKGNYQIHSVTYSNNIAPANNGKTSGNMVTINKFTSKVPKSIVLYGVNYGENKKVAYYRPMDTKNATAIQVEMTPGDKIIFKNLNIMANLGASFGNSKFTKDDIIHTGRFVFTF